MKPVLFALSLSFLAPVAFALEGQEMPRANDPRSREELQRLSDAEHAEAERKFCQRFPHHPLDICPKRRYSAPAEPIEPLED